MSPEDRQKAEQAFLHFMEEPEYFVALYMDQKAWAESSEIGYLGAFAVNSELQTTAVGLVQAIVSPATLSDMDQKQYDFDLGKTEILLSVLGMVVYKGGAFGKLQRGGGIVRHHMPPASVSPIPRLEGPAIQMDAADHQQTSSWGRGEGPDAYRQRVGNMIEEGSMRDAMATDIRDVRGRFGTKYNQAIREMLDYAKGGGYLNKK
jgi:hypothetical protein